MNSIADNFIQWFILRTYVLGKKPGGLMDCSASLAQYKIIIGINKLVYVKPIWIFFSTILNCGKASLEQFSGTHYQ